MNVFHRYTRQALRKNRSRTWVTIVGIILSVALFTAVTEGAYSGVQYLVGAAEYTVGRFHGCYQNLTEQQASQLSREEREITEQSAWQLVGWGQVGADNAYKPYLRVMSMDPDLPDMLSIRLTQGRLPEKAGELLLPEHLWSNGSVRHALGDTMELELGHRTLGGEELTADDPYTQGGDADRYHAPHLHCGGLLPAAGYDDGALLLPRLYCPDLSGAGLSDG